MEHLDTSAECLTVSKAFEKSREITLTNDAFSSLLVIAWSMIINAAVVEPVGTKAYCWEKDSTVWV